MLSGFRVGVELGLRTQGFDKLSNIIKQLDGIPTATDKAASALNRLASTFQRTMESNNAAVGRTISGLIRMKDQMGVAPRPVIGGATTSRMPGIENQDALERRMARDARRVVIGQIDHREQGDQQNTREQRIGDIERLRVQREIDKREASERKLLSQREHEQLRGMEKQAEFWRDLRSSLVGGLIGGAGIGVGYGMLQGAKEFVHAGAELNQSLVNARLQGYTPTEVQQFHQTALATNVPGFTTAEKMSSLSELGGILGHDNVTPEVLKANLLSAQAVGSITHTSPASQQLTMARFAQTFGNFETNGKLDPQKYSEDLMAATNMVRASRGNATPDQLKHTMIQAGSWMRGLDIGHNTGLQAFTTVMTEKLGDQAGADMNAMLTNFMSGHFLNDKTQGLMMRRNPEMVDFSSTLLAPNPMSHQGFNHFNFDNLRINGKPLDKKNPLESIMGFIDQIERDLGKRLGRKPTLTEDQTEISQLIRDKSGNKILSILADPTVREEIRQTQAVIDAMGPSWESLQKKMVGFNLGVTAFTTSLASAAGELATPLINDVTSVLFGLSSAFGVLAQAFGSDTGQRIIRFFTTLGELFLAKGAIRLAGAGLSRLTGAGAAGAASAEAGAGAGAIDAASTGLLAMALLRRRAATNVAQATTATEVAADAAVVGIGAGAAFRAGRAFPTAQLGRLFGGLGTGIARLIPGIAAVTPALLKMGGVALALAGGLTGLAEVAGFLFLGWQGLGILFPKAADAIANFVSAVASSTWNFLKEAAKELTKQPPMGENPPVDAFGVPMPQAEIGPKSEDTKKPALTDHLSITAEAPPNMVHHRPLHEHRAGGYASPPLHYRPLPPRQHGHPITTFTPGLYGEPNRPTIPFTHLPQMRAPMYSPTFAPSSLAPSIMTRQAGITRTAAPSMQAMQTRAFYTDVLYVTSLHGLPGAGGPSGSGSSGQPGGNAGLPTGLPSSTSAGVPDGAGVGAGAGQAPPPHGDSVFHPSAFHPGHMPHMQHQTAFRPGNPAVSTRAVDGSLTPQMRGLLDTIADKESRGKYDAKNLHSTASGRYQFLNSTWNEVAGKLGLTDKSPASQDKAAAFYAAEQYKKSTGRDLNTDLNDPKRAPDVAHALRHAWPSLPGGSQQLTTMPDFTNRMMQHMQEERGFNEIHKTPNDQQLPNIPTQNPTHIHHHHIQLDGEDISAVVAHHMIGGGSSGNASPTMYDNKLMPFVPGTSILRT